MRTHFWMALIILMATACASKEQVAIDNQDSSRAEEFTLHEGSTSRIR